MDEYIVLLNLARRVWDQHPNTARKAATQGRKLWQTSPAKVGKETLDAKDRLEKDEGKIPGRSDEQGGRRLGEECREESRVPVHPALGDRDLDHGLHRPHRQGPFVDQGDCDRHADGRCSGILVVVARHHPHLLRHQPHRAGSREALVAAHHRREVPPPGVPRDPHLARLRGRRRPPCERQRRGAPAIQRRARVRARARRRAHRLARHAQALREPRPRALHADRSSGRRGQAPELAERRQAEREGSTPSAPPLLLFSLNLKNEGG